VSNISWLNYEKPKFFFHSGETNFLQLGFAHELLSLKCISAQKGWYECLQEVRIMSLKPNPTRHFSQHETTTSKSAVDDDPTGYGRGCGNMDKPALKRIRESI
jgi:hypothetical protein